MRYETLEALKGAAEEQLQIAMLEPMSALAATWNTIVTQTEEELERRHKPIRRDELLENGPWRPGPDDAINCFVRNGVSLTLLVHPAYSIAVIKNQFSDGRTSPNVYLYSLADLDDFMRLSSQHPLPMPEFSLGEQPNT